MASRNAASYEAKAQRLEEILTRLDVLGQLDEKLREVESQVLDAFRELEQSAPAAPDPVD